MLLLTLMLRLLPELRLMLTLQLRLAPGLIPPLPLPQPLMLLRRPPLLR